MKITSLKRLKSKNLIVFDLDGTLTPTKSAMDRDMAKLMERLLMAKKVAIIGGGKYQLFQEQFLNELKVPRELLKNLFLFPTTSTTFYRYNHGWNRVYAHLLSKEQVKRIFKTFRRVFKEIGYRHPKKTYGKVIENRGTQITLSFLGQDVVKKLGKKGIALKNKWKQENTPLKLEIATRAAKYLPDLEIRAAGFTSIDVTKKGIDKGYGLRQIEKYLHVKIKDMLFVGDAIFPGGNDYGVVKTKVDYIQVKGPKQTKKVIRHLLAET